jgi:hypothetical protein
MIKVGSARPLSRQTIDDRGIEQKLNAFLFEQMEKIELQLLYPFHSIFHLTFNKYFL